MLHSRVTVELQLNVTDSQEIPENQKLVQENCVPTVPVYGKVHGIGRRAGQYEGECHTRAWIDCMLFYKQHRAVVVSAQVRLSINKGNIYMAFART